MYFVKHAAFIIAFFSVWIFIVIPPIRGNAAGKGVNYPLGFAVSPLIGRT
jgi:hypothetical protein